jgi:hypothetical protein
MLDATFFKNDLAAVFHAAGKKVAPDILDDPCAVFVWGELMSHEFVKGIIGRTPCFAPATALGYARRRTPDFFAMTEKQGACVQGVVLLGLTASETAALDKFESLGTVMRKSTTTVLIGQKKRKTRIYLKIK